MLKKVLAYILIFLPLMNVWSQRLELKFEEIFDNELLTSIITSSILQDSSGFIWIGTDQGLNRFDGYSIKKYTNAEDDNNYFPFSDITTLFVDSKQQLWIGAKSGVCKYLALKDSFRIIAENDNLKGLSGSFVKEIKESTDGYVFVSNEHGIYKYDENEDTFELKIEKKENANSTFIFDNSNCIWFGNSNTGNIEKYSQEGNLIQTIKNNHSGSVFAIHDLEIKGDNLWIATFGDGLKKYNLRTNTLKKYPYDNSYMSYVNEVFLDNQKRLWIIDLTGLKLYDSIQDIFHGYYHNDKDENSLRPAPIYMYQDKQDNYWLLHKNYGVSYSQHPRGFFYYHSTSDMYWEPSTDNITALCEDDEGNFWIGHGTNGLDIFKWQEHKIERYINDEGKQNSLGAGAVGCIFKDNSGKMWIGTNFGGLQYFNPLERNFNTFMHDPNNVNSIAGNDVRAITQDKNGNYWIAVHGFGVDKLSSDLKEFTHYNSLNSSLSGNWVFDVLVDRKNNVWVANSWGLNVLWHGQDVYTSYFSDNTDTSSLYNNQVNCLHEDNKGNIWIGTKSGVNIYNPQKGNFRRINLGGLQLYISQILSDQEGYVWFSTHRGIIRFSPEDNTFILFDEQDGLISKLYNNNAGFANNDHTLFFGGTKGIAVIYTDELWINQEPPNVLLTDFMLFYKSIRHYKNQNIINQNIAYTSEIELKYNENVIGFEFAAMNMIQPHKNKYMYMLVGFDKEWIEAGNKREATYTNLDPGEYIFMVKAANNDGVWNEKGLSVVVKISPPWWGTWWFRVFVAFFVILLISTIYLIRIQQLEKQKIFLQKKVDEKTSELNTKNIALTQQAEDMNNMNALLEEKQQHIEGQSEELRAQTENLREVVAELEKTNASKDKMFSIISHDLRSPFSGIKGFTGILIDSYYDLDDEKRLNMLSNIQISTDKVYDLLENLLTWSRSQTDTIAFSPEILNISHHIQETVFLIKHLVDQKKINLETDIEPNIFVKADANMLNTVFRNLLTNAVKFTGEKGQISLSLVKINKEVIIRFKDTGIGMTPEMIDDLFEISKQKVRVGTKGEKGSGLGLLLCKEFIERNEGSLEVASNSGEGTTFVVTFPLLKEKR